MQDAASSEQLDTDEVLQQTNKRLTLNLLIQGAAAHSFLTAHHLVGEELELLRPGLVRLYDCFAPALLLNYFIGDIPLLFGRPSRFWKQVDRPESPFRHHRLLVEHGRELWQASKRQLVSRAWKKDVMGIPVLHYLQGFTLVIRIASAERGKKTELARLAERAISMMWKVGDDRLDAELTTQVAFGNLQVPKTKIGLMVQRGAVGYGGVELRDGKFTVVAKAWFWPLLLHELVKGTAELVCLHGLNSLDDRHYDAVLGHADHIEYETWMLQAGPELWRRFLASIPPDRDLAETLMHVARLDPPHLEELMFSVIRDSSQARRMIEAIG